MNKKNRSSVWFVLVTFQYHLFDCEIRYMFKEKLIQKILMKAVDVVSLFVFV